jgi:hypothetical protein
MSVMYRALYAMQDEPHGSSKQNSSMSVLTPLKYMMPYLKQNEVATWGKP